MLASVFYDMLLDQDIRFYTGVPDSLLADICAYITDNAPESNHVIAANEGAAAGLATGYHLGTGGMPLVYMQNSGLGNVVNPLLSIADPEVYSIPMLLLIGWRGEPGVHDEPQHVKQGRVTTELLDAMEVPWRMLSKDPEASLEALQEICAEIRNGSRPGALVVPKGTFESYKLQKEIPTQFAMNREDAVKIILDSLNEQDRVVSTTGKTSREVFEYREECGQGHANDFLTVGAMGHTSQIAAGLALSRPDQRVWCLDGDGSALMHLGSLAINGSRKISNLIHIVINNGAHDSVGGQPTAGFAVDFCTIADGCGYSIVTTTDSPAMLKSILKGIRDSEGPIFLEVQVNKGARDNLGRPTTTPTENKNDFMSALGIAEY
jgi:phosphonopyruvate decarboxylase